MKNSRISVTGNYGSSEKINVKVVKTVFTGEGTLDFENTTIFEGAESVKQTSVDLDSLSDDEFSQFEADAENYFKAKYCTEGEDLYYTVY